MEKYYHRLKGLPWEKKMYGWDESPVKSMVFMQVNMKTREQSLGEKQTILKRGGIQSHYPAIG